MKRFIFSSLALVALFAASTATAANLSMSYVQPATTAIDWDGINDTNGDGTVSFSALGDAQTATLKVLCNAANGYKVTFNSSNATGTAASELKNGADAIAYTAVLGMAGVANATIVTQTLVLNNGATASVDVNFNGGGDVLPLASGVANAINLDLTFESFSGDLFPAGTYTDTITATIALN